MTFDGAKIGFFFKLQIGNPYSFMGNFLIFMIVDIIGKVYFDTEYRIQLFFREGVHAGR